MDTGVNERRATATASCVRQETRWNPRALDHFKGADAPRDEVLDSGSNFIPPDRTRIALEASTDVTGGPGGRWPSLKTFWQPGGR